MSKADSKYKTYMLVNYTDVWIDEEGNAGVNDCCVEFNDLQISDDATDKEILDYLKEIGFLFTSDMRRLIVEDMGEFIEIYQRKGYIPLCSLREVVA